MSNALIVTPLVPLVVGVLFAAFGWRRATAWAAPCSTLAVLALGAACAVRVVDSGPLTALDEQLRLDAVGCLMLILIGAVGSITTTYGVAYVGRELARGDTTPRRARYYGLLTQITVAAMILVVSANNLGVMWVAIETTTIATVLLVGHRRDAAAVEASWKYLVLGSVGVATALLGTVLVYFVARQSGSDVDSGLQWTNLVSVAPQLDPGALRLAIGLVIVGYGTKAGLAPLHSWLPDAYSQAPAPAAGLMAGALSAMSIYALLRFKVIADVAIGHEFVRRFLIVGALASLVVAASLMLTQRDYKRLLAYSSIEHIGLVALASAVGSTLAMSAALLHLLGNGLVKSVVFSATGELEHMVGSTRIDRTTGVLQRQRFVGSVLAVGLIALAGLPPFSILASEMALIRAGVDDGFGWAIAIALVAMMVIFGALAVHALNILTGPAAADATATPTSLVARIPFVGGLLVAATIGITIWPIADLLDDAAEILAR